MTDISNLKPGDALTYEQAMALPDGAVVSAVWNYDAQRTFCTVGSNNSLGVPKKFGGASLEHEDYWNYDQWHSVRLESLPELLVWVITCDRCGTTYKNNERHACAASEPAKIVIQESGTISKSVYESLLPEHHTRAACEPAKPERQASEIEKRAAWALLGELSDDVRCAATGECADIDSANVLADACRQYIEAYDYAKSIGAIE